MADRAIFGPLLATSRIRSQDLAVPGALALLSPPAASSRSARLKDLFEIRMLLDALALRLG